MQQDQKSNGAMEAINCSRNGASRKSLMSRCVYSYFFVGTLMMMMFVFNSCGDEGGSEEHTPKQLSKPEQLSAKVVGNTIILFWSAVKNADGYHIKRYCESVDNEYLSIGRISTTTFVDNYPEKGRIRYAVYPFNGEMGDHSEAAMVECEFLGSNEGEGDGDNTGTLPAPTGLNAIQSGSQINVSWSAVSGASGYLVYRSSSATGSYSSIGMTTSAYISDSSPLSGYNYYKVTAIDANGQGSGMSGYVSCIYISGGESTAKPDTPTGVTVRNEGNSIIPMITVRWNSVPNATGYNVYRSTSATGSYSLIGNTTTNTVFVDEHPREGVTYYKVKALNSAGESSYSAYASVEFKENDFSPCPVTYGNCTVSGNTITMRWTVPKGGGCGTPTKAYLRVKHPNSDKYADLQTLSGTATSASFAYGMWVNSEGYVYVGIITENAKGTSGGIPKVYDTKNKRWMY